MVEEYTKSQREYIESVDGNAHQKAVEIIGALDRLYSFKSFADDCKPSLNETVVLKFRFDENSYLFSSAVYAGNGEFIVHNGRCNDFTMIGWMRLPRDE